MPSGAAKPHSELKRLSFVRDGSTAAYSVSETLYLRLRSLTPSSLTPTLEQVESLATPLVTRAASLGQHALVLADAQVDAVVTTADKGLKHTQIQEYLSFLSKAGDYARERGSGLAQSARDSIAAASNTLQAAVNKARETADPDVAVPLAWDAWTKFASFPAVAKLLDTAEPAIKTGVSTFYSLHDNLVAAPVYAAVIDRTASTLTFATTTTPYKLGAQYLYPIVKPVADPAITTVSHSRVVNQVVEYWRPTAAVPVAAH